MVIKLSFLHKKTDNFPEHFPLKSLLPALVLSHGERDEMQHHHKDVSASLSHFLLTQLVFQPLKFILAAPSL